MILRRIFSALRRQDWATVLIDLMRPVYLEQFADLRFNPSATPLDYAALLDDTFFINLIDYRLGTIRQGELPFFADARAQVLQLVDRIDAELGGKAEAVPGGAEA